MKTSYEKSDFPVDGIRRYLEPGPIVLVSSSCDGLVGIHFPYQVKGRILPPRWM